MTIGEKVPGSATVAAEEAGDGAGSDPPGEVVPREVVPGEAVPGAGLLPAIGDARVGDACISHGEKTLLVGGDRASPLRLTFTSSNPMILREVADPKQELQPQTAAGDLFLPEGPLKNRSAVVIVSGLGGQKPERELTYGHKLAKAGVVALSLDSFGVRGMARYSQTWRVLQVTTWSILADLFAALKVLAAHPAVNSQAISVMGFSWGGMVSLLAAYEQIRRAYVGDAGLRFASHVSYYGCSLPRLEDPTTTGAEVMILLGSRDENVSVARSRLICDDLRRGGSHAEFFLFDAFHQWDGPDLDKRHVFGSLADIEVTITRDNRIVEEHRNAEIRSLLEQAFYLFLDLRWSGYDIRRDDGLHLHTDRLLLDFLARAAARGGAVPPDPAGLPWGVIGEGLAG